MAEFLEEQEMEVEALQSILMDDMAVVEGAEVRPGQRVLSFCGTQHVSGTLA